MRYFKHGFGCAVRLPSGVVDFDFGLHGQINGFDLWRLISFAGKNLDQYGFVSEQEIKSSFSSAVESDEIIPSEYIQHYLASNVV